MWDKESDISNGGRYFSKLDDHKVHYIFLDAEGDIISDEYVEDVALSSCKPIVKNDKIVYYSMDYTSRDFYTIDVNTGKLTINSFNIAGDDATWALENGALKISGTGKIKDNFSERLKSKNIKSLEIEEGITEIGKSAFNRLDGLTSVVIPEGVKK